MDISQRLMAVLASALDRTVEPADVEGTNLIDRLGLSSIDALEVLIRIEGEFGIQIDDEDLSIELVSSFSSLERYVLAKLGQPAASA